MPITVTANPVQLAWRNFTVVGATTGNHDAYTRPYFDLPHVGFRSVNGQYMLATNAKINVSPRAQVKRGANQTAALLAHEQIHYDLGVLAARAMARELEKMEAATPSALSTAIKQSWTLHTDTRLGPLQERYDLQTQHGIVGAQQQRWETLIKQGLANPNCDQVDGLPL